MFYPRYDFTKGRMLSAGRRVASVVGRRNPYGPMKRRADYNYGGGLMSAGGGNYTPYSPVYERAEDPTLAEEYIPTDRQTQNKIFRNIMLFDPIAGPAVDYYCDMAFSRYIRLGNIEDSSMLDVYEAATESSGIELKMPMLLKSYLVFGSFVLHQVWDSKYKYWTKSIIHDPDYTEIVMGPFTDDPPIINIQPNNEWRDWALSEDPRVKEQRMNYDIELIEMLRSGQPFPLPPEHTLFMPRMAFPTDYYGTSLLTRVIPFKIYEKALFDAGVAGARRRAGPVWVVNVPNDYEAEEIQEIIDNLFAAEEDPIGGKVAVRQDVTINPIGGGAADFWKLSDEWEFIRSAKLNALGISDAFITGEATFSSMEKVVQVFLEKLRAIRALFTERVIIEHMFKTLAREHGFYEKSKTEITHGYRIARKKVDDSELILPSVEWDKPLEPSADLDYWDLLERLESKGIPIPRRKFAQAAGYDINETLETADAEIEERQELYALNRALAEQAEAAGFDMEGNYIAGGSMPGGGLDLEGPAGGGGEFDLGGGGEESFELGPGPNLELEAPAGGGGGGGGIEPLPAPNTPAPAPETPELPGAGASLDGARFKIPQIRKQFRGGNTYQSLDGTLSQLPLWDEAQELQGVHRRGVAQLVDQIAHRSPKKRDGLTLTRLLRKRGLNQQQAELIQYCAARLGYVTSPQLSPDTLTLLEVILTEKAEQNGMSTELNNEFEALAYINSQRDHRSETHYTINMKTRDSDLPSDRILTGVIEK